jgi:RNA polymerase sigma-70 factor (ECF subfamily)
MCLHAARLPARLDDAGDLMPLQDQDRSRWDRALVEKGLAFLAASPPEPTEYHLEAAIAAQHSTARSYDETDWKTIAVLYDSLYEIRPSPVVALSRAIALGQLDGPERGIEALLGIADRERLERYPFYPAALGEFYFRAGRHDEARKHFVLARSLARNQAESRFLERKLSAL